MTSPLEDLLIDADSVDLERLASALKPFAAIDKKSGRLHFHPPYESLTTRRKTLVCLLGQKASHLLGLAESESLSPKEAEACSGLPGGTVRPKLTELKKDRIALTDENGFYAIAPHQVSRAVQELLDADRGGA